MIIRLFRKSALDLFASNTTRNTRGQEWPDTKYNSTIASSKHGRVSNFQVGREGRVLSDTVGTVAGRYYAEKLRPTMAQIPLGSTRHVRLYRDECVEPCFSNMADDEEAVLRVQV